MELSRLVARSKYSTLSSHLPLPSKIYNWSNSPFTQPRIPHYNQNPNILQKQNSVLLERTKSNNYKQFLRRFHTTALFQEKQKDDSDFYAHFKQDVLTGKNMQKITIKEVFPLE